MMSGIEETWFSASDSTASNTPVNSGSKNKKLRNRNKPQNPNHSSKRLRNNLDFKIKSQDSEEEFEDFMQAYQYNKQQQKNLENTCGSESKVRENNNQPEVISQESNPMLVEDPIGSASPKAFFTVNGSAKNK